MNCNCKHCGAILAAVILVFSFWDVTWTNWLTSKWIIVAAAVILLFHDFACPNKDSCKPMKQAPTKKKSKKSSKKKKKK